MYPQFARGLSGHLHPEHGHRHHPEHGHRHHPEHGPFGPGAPGGRGRRGGLGGRGRGRGRAQRGDVRTAALLLLGEQPMHGYQLMQAIAERSGGAWRPSPGAIYPTLNQLEDEGLVTMTTDGGRKLVTLTEAGRAYLDEHGDSLADPFADFARGSGQTFDLRSAMEGLAVAMTQIARTGNETQLVAAQKVLAETRRSLYLILAEDPGALGTATESESESESGSEPGSES
jgi:DNA-binding PadR family transcriptional regulator